MEWSDSQEKSFIEIKKRISENARLAIYDPEKELTIENDASEFGLGAVLLQDGKPIAYASRTLSDCERNYAQIEKEMLAIVFGLKKFHHYAYGRRVKIVTDHKPLTSIAIKPLSKAPKRLQCMLLKIQEYDYTLEYKTGTEIPTADALSRSPVGECENVHMTGNLEETPINENRFQQIERATKSDPTMTRLKEVIARGWPENKEELSKDLLPYYNFRDEMTIEEGLILRGERTIIASSLRYDMKKKIHPGHLGINL